jgi:hypothetical protein
MLQSLSEGIAITNHLIGREQAEHCVRILAQQDECSESNGRCRVSTDWFCDHLLSRKPRESWRKISPQQSPLVMIQKLTGLSKSLHTMNRLLNHRLSSVEGQQLLRAPLAAERPKARAAPTGENDGIKIGLNPFHLEL